MQEKNTILNPNHPIVKVFDLIGYLVILMCFGYVTTTLMTGLSVVIPNETVLGIITIVIIVTGATILNRVISLRRFVANSLPKPEKMPAKWDVVHNTQDNRKDQ